MENIIEEIIKDIHHLFEPQVNKKSGGKNTNLFGKKYEFMTNIEDILLISGFQRIEINKTKFGFYFLKKTKKKEIVYTVQNGFKLYVKNFLNIESLRIPDEAFIIKEKDKYNFYIIEKKHQRVEGSAETKLWSSPLLKREYELWLYEYKIECQIHYILSLSNFFKEKFNCINNKKYKYLEISLAENNIKVLYGEDSDYFVKILTYIKTNN